MESSISSRCGFWGVFYVLAKILVPFLTNYQLDKESAKEILSSLKEKLEEYEELTAEYLNNEEYFHDYYTDVEISYAASMAHPKSAIQIRNREMVDRADLVLCAIERESGGAWQTIQYAIKQGKTVINLAEDTENSRW